MEELHAECSGSPVTEEYQHGCVWDREGTLLGVSTNCMVQSQLIEERTARTQAWHVKVLGTVREQETREMEKAQAGLRSEG